MLQDLFLVAAGLVLLFLGVNRRAKLTPYRRPKLTPYVPSRSGPEPTELITEWRRVWMPPVWQAESSICRRGLRSDVCQASERGLHDATGRYAVRKAGFTSVQRAASARAPGLNLPALNFEVRVAYSSSIAHPGLSAMSCRFPSWVRVTPFGNPALLL